MKEQAFLSVVQAIFQYGPFAILPYFLAFVMPQLYKQMKAAPKEMRLVLKRNILIYQVMVVVLLVTCVGYWIYYFSGPTYYYGEILKIDPKEYEIKSPTLFLNSSVTSGEYSIQWVWKKDKEHPDACIRFMQGTDPDPKMRFYLYSGSLKRGYCRLIYDKQNGVLTYHGEPLPSEPQAMSLIRRDTYPMGYLYAAQSSLDIEQTINLLQAVDSNVRSETIDRVARGKSDTEKRLVVTKGFGILRDTIQSQANAPGRSYSTDYLFTSLLSLINILAVDWRTDYTYWDSLIHNEGFDIIVAGAGDQNPDIARLSISFLFRFQKEMLPYLEAKLGTVPYQANQTYMRGAISYLSRTPSSKTLLQGLAGGPGIAGNPDLAKMINKSLARYDAEQTAQAIKPSYEQLKRVIDLAWRLKDMNVSYKWGGKTEKDGFDSSGFIAYILHEAGVIEKPGSYWSGKFRSTVGEKRIKNEPKEIGDLVFFNGGGVMLYLGKDEVIGMTVNGVVVKQYQTFLGGPIQVNKVIYH
jgi:cell wall-associated NlpC family hydrolase